MLSRAQKTTYGAGDMSISLAVTIVGAYFAIFLTDVVGLSPGLAAIALFVGRSWDYVNDPLVGYLSDRTRSRWGRRRPYLLFGAVPFGLAFALMWWRPPFDAQAWLVVYYALAYLVFDAAVTVVYMPYVSLTPELTQDYDERTSLTSYRMAFSLLASLIAFVVPAAMIGRFYPDNASRVLTMGLVFGLACIAPILVTFFGTSERSAYEHQEQPKLIPSIRAALRNRPFVFGMVMFLLTWMSIALLQATLLYFIKYVLVREAQADLIMAAIFVTALVTLPIWLAVSNRSDKRRAYVIGIAFWAAVQVVLVLLSGKTPLALVMAMCVLAGVGVAAAHVLPWSIIPDAIEWDEWKTGARHEGMFYSIVTLAQKVASSIAVPLALLLLEAAGYEGAASATGADELVAAQSESAVNAIRVLVGPIPAMLLIAGILFALNYPLDREEHRRVTRELELRRAGNEGD
jgi:glycoside/pentoside/hexuronide:cation symporter, GPH family